MKPSTVFLGEMTNPEVEAFLKEHHTVIIPTGATEQHGPHAPLLTDVLIPQEVARREDRHVEVLGEQRRLGPLPRPGGPQEDDHAHVNRGSALSARKRWAATGAALTG